MISSFVGKILKVDQQVSMKERYLWNTIGTFLYALSTFVMTVVVSRSLGSVLGSQFSFAITTAQLMATIAYFETRTFYLTDSERKYAFSDYYTTKMITSSIMILVTFIYVGVQGYSVDKIIVILLVCLLKLADAFSDVFEAEFQQENRIDIAGKVLAIRTTLSTVLVCVLSVITKNIILTLVITNIVVILSVIVFNYMVIGKFAECKVRWNAAAIKAILIGSFPLFVSSFVSTYLSTAPKNAIDSIMPDYQIHYTAIFMPLMVINLFSGFMFKPMLNTMTDRYGDRKFKEIKNILLKMFAGIVGFTVVCMIGGSLIGIPVLGIFYNVNLVPYRGTFMILLMAGGMNALGIVLYYVLSIMRKQVSILVVYCMAAILVTLLAKPLTLQYGLMGAAVAYLIAMSATCLSFVVIIIKKFKREERV